MDGDDSELLMPWYLMVQVAPLDQPVTVAHNSDGSIWSATVGRGKRAQRVTLSLSDPAYDRRTGTLFLDDLSGTCTCRSRNPPCAHVATVLAHLQETPDARIPTREVPIDETLRTVLADLLSPAEEVADTEQPEQSFWWQDLESAQIRAGIDLVKGKGIWTLTMDLTAPVWSIEAGFSYRRKPYRCKALVHDPTLSDPDQYLMVRDVQGRCDCTVARRGTFCKHLIACLILLQKHARSHARSAPSPDQNTAGPSSGSTGPLPALPGTALPDLVPTHDADERLVDWLADLYRARKPPTGPDLLVFRLMQRRWGGLAVDIRSTRPRQGGSMAVGRAVLRLRSIADGTCAGATAADSRIAEELIRAGAIAEGSGANQVTRIPDRQAGDLVHLMVATGRAYWDTDEALGPLQWGAELPARYLWSRHGNHWQLIEEPDDDAGGLLPGTKLVRRDRYIHRLVAKHPAERHPLLERLPLLSDSELAAVWPELQALVPELPQPPVATTATVAPAPVPIAFRLRGQCDRYDGEPSPVEAILPLVAYGELVTGLEADPPEFLDTPTGGLLRDRYQEEAAHRQLTDQTRPAPEGLRLPEAWRTDRSRLRLPLPSSQSDPAGAFPDELWTTLRDMGWHITDDPDHLIPRLPRGELLPVDIKPGAGDDAGKTDWFDLHLGLTIDGQDDQPIGLLPAIAGLLAEDVDPTSLPRDPAAPDHLVLTLPDHGRVAVPAQPILDLLAHLRALFDSSPAGNRPLQLHALQTIGLDDPLLWRRPERLQRLADELCRAPSPEAQPLPRSLETTLYAYQVEGLAWLQRLHRLGVGGILADDMGLGKTVQTLAHLQCLQEDGALATPALVICPRSMIGVWRQEAARFTPRLQTALLHGPGRERVIDRLEDHHLLITTYATLARDVDQLAAREFSVVICDEAQAVKNHRSRTAQAIRRLDGRQRLALTGTPLENHLGELWSLFDWLTPGLLGGRQRFDSCFRTPIEVRGDTERAELLRRRVAPFLLRRRKDAVATDLPPKTVTVLPVTFDQAQQTLYESVRAAVDERVRSAMADKGLARSHIEVLEALLRLRQVCCHPRLLRSVDHQVTASAKLDLLLDLLPTLVEDGRRIIVFSQFASMLSLIGEALDQADLPWQQLTGRTRKRQPLIDRFQAGEVPIFLISLKAGGTGLTLTAADTVIHFDPWWNPAVEDQATDRAHRIGQDRPVLVYRLIVSGSVEERVHHLQDRKRQLADNLYDEEGQAVAALAEADIDALLAPLGD